MRKNKFIFMEPSKVGVQHITLLDGYLQAILEANIDDIGFELQLVCSQATFENLSNDVRAKVRHKKIIVMDPIKRRLVLKSLVELWCILRGMAQLRSGDKLLVTCVLPPALLAVELINKFWRRRNVYISLHGETEALLDSGAQDIRSYGYWVWKWWAIRKRSSLINLVVIDDFIKQKLVEIGCGKIQTTSVYVLHHPVVPKAYPRGPLQDKAKVCFIGYRSKPKGFDDFAAAAAQFPQHEFVAIGGGKVEQIPSGADRDLTDLKDFERAISSCDLALFPYVRGYDISLSAAALDALAMGVPIAATSRNCFLALQDHFGPKIVQCYADRAALIDVLTQLKSVTEPAQQDNMDRVRTSAYSTGKLAKCMRRLLSP